LRERIKADRFAFSQRASVTSRTGFVSSSRRTGRRFGTSDGVGPQKVVFSFRDDEGPLRGPGPSGRAACNVPKSSSYPRPTPIMARRAIAAGLRPQGNQDAQDRRGISDRRRPYRPGAAGLEPFDPDGPRSGRQGINVYHYRQLARRGSGARASHFLRLCGPLVTDEVVTDLARRESGLPHLTELGLSGTAVTDAGVSELARPDSGLKNLRALDLSVTD